MITTTTQSPPAVLSNEEASERATALLRERLGSEWSIRPTKRGCRARFRLLSVSLKYHPEEEGAWRCRLRDSFPRRTLIERRSDDLNAATEDVVARAIHARAMIRGELGLAQTPAKSWLAYRLWSAVRQER